jgi:hypothetical protein
MAPKRYALERRVGTVVVIEMGRMGVRDVAVFYSSDYDIALAVVHFLNGDMSEAERLRGEWLAGRSVLTTTILVPIIFGVCAQAWAEGATQPPTPVALTWPSLLTLAATTGLLVAAFNFATGWLKEIWNHRRTAKRQARTLASKLIHELENFAAECYDQAIISQFDYNVHGTVPSVRVPLLQSLRDLGSDEAWDVIDSTLKDRALGMNLERDRAFKDIDGTSYAFSHGEGTSEDVAETYFERVASVGLKAAEIAEALRSEIRSPRAKDAAIVGVVSGLTGVKASNAPKP